MTQIPGWWTVQELAARTGLHEQTIRYHCRQGNIKAEDTGRIWMISDEAAEAFCWQYVMTPPEGASRDDDATQT
jgi:excisionase family DNA binding protein